MKFLRFTYCLRTVFTVVWTDVQFLKPISMLLYLYGYKIPICTYIEIENFNMSFYSWMNILGDFLTINTHNLKKVIETFLQILFSFYIFISLKFFTIFIL